MSNPGGITQAADHTPDADMATLAQGGRLNVFGFILRLVARLPFLIIGGQMYGTGALGRFAYAVLVVEFAAQLSTLGLRRGLAQLLADAKKPQACVVADALLVAAIGSVICMAILIAFPIAMYPDVRSPPHGMDRYLAVTVLAVSWTDIALAALAYQHDVGATVRARSIVEPWVISIVAFVWVFISTEDGLIVAYVFSMVAALIAALIPLVRCYGIPHEWTPDLPAAWRTARRNIPLAAADMVEWASRRVDLAVLGAFMPKEFVGIYYVAQQVATLPAKLKTSFEPVLGPAIARKIAVGDRKSVAKQVRQVTYWIIAAQCGIALALGIPGRAVMSIVGSGFTGGTAMLGFLLAAEVIAATAVVSEAALIYMAKLKNLWISIATIALQGGLTLAGIWLVDHLGFGDLHRGAAAAAALMLALGAASVAKSMLLSRLLAERINNWRWALVWAAAPAVVVGWAATKFLPEWAELAFGVPAILGLYCWVIWVKGFGHEDRALFRKSAAH